MFKKNNVNEAAANKRKAAMEQKPFQKRGNRNTIRMGNFCGMRKFLTLSFFTLLTFVTVNAQDIIITKEGKKIDAVVLEIELDVVKYKYFDNQIGPTISIRKSDIASIVYQNGSVEVFNSQTPTPTPHNEYSSELKTEFDRIGTDDELMLIFFQKNNFIKQYNDFESACKMRKSGKTLLGVGLGFSSTGLIIMLMGIIDVNNGNANIGGVGAMITGGVLEGIGNVLTIVSIPVSASAGARKKAIKNNFAREKFGVSGYTYQPTLNFDCTGNGFGLTLKF